MTGGHAGAYVVCKNQYQLPAHEALCLVVKLSTPVPDDRTAWKRPGGRPRQRQTWIHQLEIDVGLVADAAWATAGDRDLWNDPSPVKRSSECQRK